MNYKKITIVLFVLVCVLLPRTANAQGVPVYDNTNFISFAKSIIESAKQTSQLLKTVDFLKKQKERIEKVNAVIKQLNAVKALYKNNERLYNLIQDDLRAILNSPHIKPDEVVRVSESFDAIIEKSLEDLDFVSQILTSNSLNMTDAERTLFLKEKEEESKEMVAEVTLKAKRYKEIIAFRDFQERINNRETNY
ncbi:conjugal transfer protein [Tamlana sp. 2_MG-2023]|uniref:conjugal transfer protein n=1 Tax=unclassified Tamlana TaxID=2614803 RepID=UPI0026E2E835|nr:MULTISPECIES: conjugal transfer protein [unclassified Tamlana]MDO6761867.1 conjugal transfer protein [Tamlana sp. 2_MG-2023]MDO6792638.1 conjugal transfer protein [Tamlana sp. 1_MG-2023]